MGIIEDAAIAFTDSDHKWFWAVRDQVEFIFSFGKPVYTFDVSLCIADMEAYIDELKIALNVKFKKPELYVFGHAGDGNLHLFIICEGTKRQVEAIVYGLLKPIGGSITAEHGIGLEKKEWLSISRSEAEIALMKSIKQTLDPKGIMNPGKML